MVGGSLVIPQLAMTVQSSQSFFSMINCCGFYSIARESNCEVK